MTWFITTMDGPIEEFENKVDALAYVRAICEDSRTVGGITRIESGFYEYTALCRERQETYYIFTREAGMKHGFEEKLQIPPKNNPSNWNLDKQARGLKMLGVIRSWTNVFNELYAGRIFETQDGFVWSVISEDDQEGSGTVQTLDEAKSKAEKLFQELIISINPFKPLLSPRPPIGILDQDKDKDEWEFAWKRLLQVTGDPNETMENNGECWQYMGSIYVAPTWVHQFRHRNHPSTNQRVYKDITASKNFAGFPKARIMKGIT